MKTTATGIPIETCGRCGYEHPVTRKHCVSCECPTLFIDPATGLCVQCKQLPHQSDIFEQLQEVIA